jgi:hypothetical protein
MRRRKSSRAWGWALMVCVLAALSLSTAAQKGAAAKSDVSGHYEGTAKNNAGEVITVALDLAEKDGAMTGMIKSSHGDFAITGGTHHGEEVTLDFDANGTAGSITLRSKEDELTGIWSAGDDGGPVEVKKAAAPAGDAKGKS